MRRANGFIVMYSIANRSSFDQVSSFMEQIGLFKDLANPETVPIILVGYDMYSVLVNKIATSVIWRLRDKSLLKRV